MKQNLKTGTPAEDFGGHLRFFKNFVQYRKIRKYCDSLISIQIFDGFADFQLIHAHFRQTLWSHRSHLLPAVQSGVGCVGVVVYAREQLGIDLDELRHLHDDLLDGGQLGLGVHVQEATAALAATPEELGFEANQLCFPD